MTTAHYACELALVDGAVRADVAVAVDAGRFVSVVPDASPAPDAVTLPGLTLPGFANAHSHAFHRALRSRTQAAGGSFWTWRDVMYRAAERLDPDAYFRLARAAFAEMALAGFACVGEFHYLHHQRDGTRYDDTNAMGHAVLAAAHEAGLRITLLDTVYLHGGLEPGGYRQVDGAQRRYSDGSVDAWAQRVEELDVSGGQRLGAAVHSVRAVDPDSIAAVAKIAKERGWPLHAHVSEQPAENDQCRALHAATPTGLLHGVGALGEAFTAVHATHLAGDDATRLGATGSTVCVCPSTERDLGDGIGPTVELVAAGVALALGTDSHAMIDPFEEMRGLELDERLRAVRRGAHTAADLLTHATATGHRSLGWDDAGTIAPGCRADLTTISLDSVRTAGASSATALETAVFAATAADVTHVVIDGRVVVAEGAHVALDVASELHASITELLD